MSEQMYRQAEAEFEKLSSKEKKEKLLELIKAFGDAHPIFGELTYDISSYDYSDNQYISIYKIILKSIYEIDQKGLEAGVKKIEQLHQFLVELRTKEAEEVKKEGNADERLEKVLSNI